jgi:hypothetical protein
MIALLNVVLLFFPICGAWSSCPEAVSTPYWMHGVKFVILVWDLTAYSDIFCGLHRRGWWEAFFKLKRASRRVLFLSKIESRCWARRPIFLIRISKPFRQPSGNNNQKPEDLQTTPCVVGSRQYSTAPIAMPHSPSIYFRLHCRQNTEYGVLVFNIRPLLLRALSERWS